MGDWFGPSKQTSYIQNLDANNLYGWAMRKCLPVGEFKWMTDEDLGLPLNEMPPCFIKVDGTNFEKLAPNLIAKINNVCHIENLKMYVSLGVRLIKFREEAWLKPYIDLNTKLRSKATNDADKNMFKLLNNTGSKPQFKHYTIYNKDLIGVSLEPSKVKLNKPNYDGIAIL